MTVDVTNQKVTGNGNGSGTVFSFSPITIFATSEISVTLVSSTGVETPLVEGTGDSKYSVSITSPNSLPSVGSITYPEDAVTPIANGVSVVMKRIQPLTQLTDLENQGGYFSDTQEEVFDRGIMIDIQQQEELDRALQFPIADPSSSIGEIPKADDRKSTGLVFDADGKPIAGNTTTTAVSVFMKTVVDDLTAEAARTTLGLEAARSITLFNHAL